MNWQNFKNFKQKEFDSPDELGSGKKMQKTFLAKLQKARTIANIPFNINSGFRTPSQNEKVHGVKDSAHLTGHAADIRTTPETYATILKSLIEANFKRIGLATNYIHADNDPTKKSPTVWVYNPNLNTLRTKILQILKKTKDVSWITIFTPLIILTILYTALPKKGR